MSLFHVKHVRFGALSRLASQAPARPLGGTQFTRPDRSRADRGRSGRGPL